MRVYEEQVFFSVCIVIAVVSWLYGAVASMGVALFMVLFFLLLKEGGKK